MLSVSLDLWLNLGAKEEGSLHWHSNMGALDPQTILKNQYTSEVPVLLQNPVLAKKLLESRTKANLLKLVPINKWKPSIPSHRDCCVNILSEHIQHEVSVQLWN